MEKLGPAVIICWAMRRFSCFMFCLVLVSKPP